MRFEWLDGGDMRIAHSRNCNPSAATVFQIGTTEFLRLAVSF